MRVSASLCHAAMAQRLACCFGGLVRKSPTALCNIPPLLRFAPYVLEVFLHLST